MDIRTEAGLPSASTSTLSSTLPSLPRRRNSGGYWGSGFQIQTFHPPTLEHTGYLAYVGSNADKSPILGLSRVI